MSKKGFLLGTIVGAAASLAAALKITDTKPEDFKNKAKEKVNEAKQNGVFEPDNLKEQGEKIINKAKTKFDEAKEKGVFEPDNLKEQGEKIIDKAKNKFDEVKENGSFDSEKINEKGKDMFHKTKDKLRSKVYSSLFKGCKSLDCTCCEMKKCGCDTDKCPCTKGDKCTKCSDSKIIRPLTTEIFIPNPKNKYKK